MKFRKFKELLMYFSEAAQLEAFRQQASRDMAEIRKEKVQVITFRFKKKNYPNQKLKWKLYRSLKR